MITDQQALLYLFPRLRPMNDYILDATGKLVLWKNTKVAEPSSGDLTTAKASIQSLKESLLSLRTQLRAIYEGLQPGEQAFYRPVFGEVSLALGMHNIARAKEIIATSPAINDTMVSIQNQLLALFP